MALKILAQGAWHDGSESNFVNKDIIWIKSACLAQVPKP